MKFKLKFIVITIFLFLFLVACESDKKKHFITPVQQTMNQEPKDCQQLGGEPCNFCCKSLLKQANGSDLNNCCLHNDCVRVQQQLTIPEIENPVAELTVQDVKVWYGPVNIQNGSQNDIQNITNVNDFAVRSSVDAQKLDGDNYKVVINGIEYFFSVAMPQYTCQNFVAQITNLTNQTINLTTNATDRSIGRIIPPSICSLIAGNGNPKNLDILYIGDKFADLQLFNSVVSKSANEFLSYAPFSTSKDKINIWMLNELTALDCVTLEPRMFQCNTAKIASNRIKCPNDQVVIMMNIDEGRGFGSFGGDVSGVSSWSGNPLSVVVHESGGHSIGNLEDEYLRGVNYVPNPNSLNCDIAGCPKFKAVNHQICIQECASPNFYRSVENGMMRTLNQPFGIYNENLISAKLARYGQ